jgi:hypothetical protein
MKNILRYLIIIVALSLFNRQYTDARTVSGKQYKCNLSFPESMLPVTDSAGSNEEEYYDSSAGIVLIISGRKSRFKSVSQYIDCSRQNLEQTLRESYGDSTLDLIDYRTSDVYPGNSTVIHFHVSSLPYGFNTYVVYFIHYKKQDIQLSFTYNKDAEPRDINYIQKLMKTLKLQKI